MRLDYEALDTIADTINPLLALCALILPWVLRPAITIGKYYLALFLSIGFVYLVMILDNATGVLPTIGFDYSTHSAFAASVGVSLGVLRRPLWGVVALLFTLYGGLMLYQAYHSLSEIVISGVLAGTVTLILHKMICTTQANDARSEA